MAPRNERRSTAALTVALVERVYVLAGRPYLACMDPSSGQKWDRVPFCTTGGGTRTFAYSPVAAPLFGLAGLAPDTGDGAQALLVHTGHRRTPYCVGVLAHPALGMTDLRVPVALADLDVDTAPRIGDHHAANGGSHVVLDEYGAVTVDTTGAADPHVRVQMPAGGVARFARAGQSQDRPVLASTALAYLAKLEAKIAEFELLVRAATAGGNPLVIGPSVAELPKASTSALKAATIHVAGDAEN